MSDKIDRHKVKELKEMLQNRKPDEPVEKVLAVFCERHGVSIDVCRVFYKQIVEEGKSGKKV
ncbi:MAG: hypothetical protein NWE98_07110 [Candidatus Bathyarchaeota archaeon]|nr:hypothetical protein [Candidatus Bathyarchaeota archaeon]